MDDEAKWVRREIILKSKREHKVEVVFGIMDNGKTTMMVAIHDKNKLHFLEKMYVGSMLKFCHGNILNW